MSRSPHLPLDDYARSVIAEQPHAIVAWWLMASFLYYQTDECLLTDACFDALSHEMLARWDEIEHPHKHLIDRDALAAGTGYYIRARAYPTIAIDAAIRLAEEGPEAVDHSAATKPLRTVLLAHTSPNAREHQIGAVVAAISSDPEQGELFG